MATIAEWIEIRKELVYLKEISLAYGQVYLFGKPNPAAGLTVRGNSQKKTHGATARW